MADHKKDYSMGIEVSIQIKAAKVNTQFIQNILLPVVKHCGVDVTSAVPILSFVELASI